MHYSYVIVNLRPKVENPAKVVDLRHLRRRRCLLRAAAACAALASRRAHIMPRRLAQCPLAPSCPGRAHGQTARRGALKTQELGRATVCTRESASI